MALNKHISQIILIALGGLIIMTLSACSLTKGSRAWIEKNCVVDIYKVYPTKNPKDLFKVFPDGFDITQVYTNPDGVMYQLELEGEPKTKTIKGQFVINPYSDNKAQKLSEVVVENNQVVFSNEADKKEWPIKGLLFQHLTINQKKIDGLKERKHSYNSNSGIFHISYKLTDSRVNKLLKKENKQITDFEITGSGKNYYGRTIVFRFSDHSEFSEMINRPYN
ncbi:hypothetical protein LGW72_08610 [Streptococcus mutans]|nr:hypothetical protein [Streptococcus mutans]MCB4960698.1 hypothetical protein [Streptococcus mutans]